MQGCCALFTAALHLISKNVRVLMPTQIKFGTSGWRAIMADEFIFENVRRAVTGIARHISEIKPTGAKVIVGRDPRFLGETFVEMAAVILEQHGIQPLI